MYFVKKGYKPDVTVLKDRLRHWSRLGHLRPEKGIALLVGLDPNDMCIETLGHWEENISNDDKTLDCGVMLLHGCIICNWFPSGSNADHTNRKNESTDDFVRRARHIFSTYVFHYRQQLEYWYSDVHPEYTPLKYFVKWARLKGLSLYWESVFIELEKIMEETLANDNKKPEDKSIAEPERERLLKQIAVLALTLAKTNKTYTIAEKPNASSIANNTVKILDALPDANTRGVGVSSIRESIKKGLELLVMLKK